MFSFGSLSPSFSFPWGDFSGSFGYLWKPLDHFGEPWVAMEETLGYLGAYCKFLNKLDVQFPGNGPQACNLHTESGRPELISKFPTIPWILAKWRKGRSSQSPFSRAGGQDDASLEQTSSNDL